MNKCLLEEEADSIVPCIFQSISISTTIMQSQYSVNLNIFLATHLSFIVSPQTARIYIKHTQHLSSTPVESKLLIRSGA